MEGSVRPTPPSADRPTLRTRRLVLRALREEDDSAFEALNADPAVMEHYPSVLSPEESAALALRLREAWATSGSGLGVWAVEVPGRTAFAGFVGFSQATFDAPHTPCTEIVWRLSREAWGHGYAREAATAALTYAFATRHLEEVLAWTVPMNARSERVMQAIGLVRSPEDDFEHPRLPPGHRLRHHIVYRLDRATWARRGGEVVATSPLEIAAAFASALDADDFERARPLLAPDCVYLARGITLRGPDEILGSYADATRGAHARFDEVRYESRARLDDLEERTIVIGYTDILRLRDREHRHRCEQVVRLGEGDRIVEIRHCDLPGEREAVEAFLKTTGESGC